MAAAAVTFEPETRPPRLYAVVVAAVVSKCAMSDPLAEADVAAEKGVRSNRPG